MEETGSGKGNSDSDSNERTLVEDAETEDDVNLFVSQIVAARLHTGMDAIDAEKGTSDLDSAPNKEEPPKREIISDEVNHAQREHQEGTNHPTSNEGGLDLNVLAKIVQARLDQANGVDPGHAAKETALTAARDHARGQCFGSGTHSSTAAAAAS